MARLLYLHQHFSTPAGSTATRSHAQARALVRAGHAVTLVTGRFEGAVTGLDTPFRRGRREGRVDGIRVVEFDIPYGNAMGLAARSLAFLRYAARATRLAVSERWDVVIASSTPLTVVLPALEARRRHGTPFLFEMRDPWPELPAALGLRARPVLAAMGALADAACRRARRVVALSEGMAAIARGRGAAEVAVIPQGADLDLFGPQVAPWRPEGVGSHEILAVYAGAHGAANGLGLLLEAARLLAARDERRVRLVLVGEGGEKPALVAQAAGLPNLTFLDPMPKCQVAGLLAGAQVGLLCLAPVPEFAGQVAPNKLVDVLAAGLPVLSNLPGETAELLSTHGAGQTVGARDAAALADALTRLADDPARRRAMGEAARALAMRRFDRRLLTARFVAEVEACLP
ncbi:glycosyltransferase family 4 protein [Roseococcus thiosulfatophilus]|uniref:glycosyltransferase family 4 protein n=1 Tax=Roseococcus thiosulfatophilus TaxID=35813 RepID=UPI001A8E6EEC|nr:glycosyltransferase family 4 protein [Roseococcus thiosulfatophilus]